MCIAAKDSEESQIKATAIGYTKVEFVYAASFLAYMYMYVQHVYKEFVYALCLLCRAMLTKSIAKAKSFHHKKLLDRSFLRSATLVSCLVSRMHAILGRYCVSTTDGGHGISTGESLKHVPHKS